MNSQSNPEDVPSPSIPNEANPALPLVPAAIKGQPSSIALDRTFGQVDILSAVEQTRLLTCEAVISMGRQNFADVGLALAQIRDEELYRVDFDSFDTYCRAKWQYARRSVYQLIAAAQLFKHLCAIAHSPKPEHESQLRPLIGLTPEDAQKAWQSAVEKACGGRITARLVKTAVQSLQLGDRPGSPELSPRPSEAEMQRTIEGALGELLVLVGQKAAHETLTAKLEALHGHVRALFAGPRAQAAGTCPTRS